jgi:hypothetical protein
MMTVMELLFATITVPIILTPVRKITIHPNKMDWGTPATVKVILTAMQIVTGLMQQHSRSISVGVDLIIPARAPACATGTSIVMGIVTGPMQHCSN